jgi:hypothetical protein
MKLLTPHSLLLAIAGGLLLSFLALAVRSTEWLHPSTWDPNLPAWSSDSVEVAVWGWPLYCAVDHPWRGRIASLELSELVLDRMAANWLFFTLLVLYGRGLWAASSRRGLIPQPLAVAGLLAPMSVFIVVQSLLPWFAAEWWNEPAIGTVFLQSTLPALLVTLAAFPLILGIALPLAWLLDRKSRLRPRFVAPLGAALGILPLVVAIRDPAEQTATLAALYLMGAVAGALYALTFWAFSGRRSRPPSKP